MFYRAYHTQACPSRKESKNDVVSENKRVERERLADGPWSVFSLLVDAIEQGDSCCIDNRNRDR